MAIGLFIPGAIQKNQEMLTAAFFNAVCRFAGREVKVIDFFNSDKLRKLITEDVEILKFDIVSVCDSLLDWNKVYDECCKFLVENNIDTAISYRILLSSVSKFGKEDKIAKQIAKTVERPDKGFNFVIAKKTTAYLQFIRACSTVCENYYHYTVDPQEPLLCNAFDFNNFADLYFNAAKRRGSIVMPFYEFELSKNELTPLGKQAVPFTFYCTALTDDRKFIADMRDDFENIDGWDVNIVNRDRKQRRTLTSQQQYMFMLSQSKSSLVIKSYDHQAFSWMRFEECIYNNCLPFVWDDCCLQDISNIYSDVSEIIKDRLFVGSIEELKEKVEYFDKHEKKRQKLVKEIRNSIEQKHVVDIQWLQDRWQKLKGLK